MHYRRGLYVDTGVGENGTFLTRANEFCAVFGLTLEKTEGTQSVLEECLQGARNIGLEQSGLILPTHRIGIMNAPSFERAQEIRNAVKLKYRSVAQNPEGYFAYPVGVQGALKLGYDPSWIELVPETAANRFVGVGNPFNIRVPEPGDRVLDAGCGCGFDTFIAASMTGVSGMAVGIDITSEMLQVAQTAAALIKAGNVEFREGSIEQLPFEDGCFDLVISNGVLNLIPDKQRAFKEIARVLRTEGALVSADLLVIETIPPEVLASTDAWST